MLVTYLPFLLSGFKMNESGSIWQNVTPWISATASFSDGTIAPGDRDEHYKEFYKTAQFVTGLVFYPILCIVGITGNSLTLIVLNHRKMRTSTNVFLRALAVADTLKLINDTLYFVNLVLMNTNPVAANTMMGHMYPFSHYILNESVCVTAWLTVSIAVERYIFVCHPTKAKEICTIQNAVISSTVVFILMSIIAFPSAIRYKKITVYENVTNTSMYEIVLSEYGSNVQFMRAYLWGQNLLRSIIPLFVLIILNVCIIKELKKERVRGKKMSSTNRITMMLLSVILVFLICIIPDAIMSTFFGFGYVDGDNLVKGIREISDTLLTFNSAVNFIIYCLFSKIFRDTCMQIFCKKSASNKHHLDENQTRLLSEKRDHASVTPKRVVLNGESGRQEQSYV